MRVPDRLNALLEEGIITDVVRPLMSGKEAQVYLVRSGGELGVAKIYKEASERTFKHRTTYTEGRGVRSSRDARAMQKRSRYGRSVDEEAWRSAEVEVIYRLRDAGVRVPEPYAFVEGVLVMELVTDELGEPAPRLGEVELDPEIAPLFFEVLLKEVVRMTCAGVVHGDLSEFNILVGPDGPVIIDFPQAVDPASNPNARKLLIRDVDNLVRFIGRYQPKLRGRPYGQELWELYEQAKLTPDTVLTGQWTSKAKAADAGAVLRELRDVEREHDREVAGRGEPPSGRRGRKKGGRGPAKARSEPDARGPQAGERSAQSGARGSQSGARGSQSGARGSQSGARGSQSGARGSQSGARGSQSGARGSQSGARGSQSGARGDARRDPGGPKNGHRVGVPAPPHLEVRRGEQSKGPGGRSASDGRLGDRSKGPRVPNGPEGRAVEGGRRNRRHGGDSNPPGSGSITSGASEPNRHQTRSGDPEARHESSELPRRARRRRRR